MESLFLSILVFVCGGMEAEEKALCTQQMVACYEKSETEMELVKSCLKGTYLEWYKATQAK